MMFSLLCVRVFLIPGVAQGKSVIIFAVDNSLLIHPDSRKKDSLVLGEGSTQGLEGVTISAEAKYYNKINFV